MTSWKLSSSGAQRRGVTWPSLTIHTSRCRKSFLIDCLSSLQRSWNNRALRVVVVSHRSWENYASQRVILCFFLSEGEPRSWRVLLDLSIFLALPHYSRKETPWPDVVSPWLWPRGFEHPFRGNLRRYRVPWEKERERDCRRAPVSISALPLVLCLAVTLV